MKKYNLIKNEFWMKVAKIYITLSFCLLNYYFYWLQKQMPIGEKLIIYIYTFHRFAKQCEILQSNQNKY